MYNAKDIQFVGKQVSGSPLNKEKVFECCNKIVKDLDANIWDGRKTVTIK
jgi:hypothetical protein